MKRLELETIRQSPTCNIKCNTNNYQAHLVSIHSEEEHQFVVGLDGGFPWLGGRRDPGKGNNFVWSDGTPWDYSNWDQGQPDDYNGNEDCAHLWEHNGITWNDRPCSHVRTFVCKKGKKVVCRGKLNEHFIPKLTILDRSPTVKCFYLY